MGGMQPTKNSSNMMQDATTSTWPSMPATKRSESYISSQNMEPLQPVARPIFTVDPLSFERDQKSNAISFVIHAVVITLILTLALKARTIVEPDQIIVSTPVDFKLTVPPPMVTPPIAKVEGGGGAKAIVQPKPDPIPTIAKAPQISTHSIIRLDQPKLALAPTEQVKMPDEVNPMPAFAAANTPQIEMAKAPKGTGTGFGSIGGGGLGGGHGVGSGGGYGGGLMSVGGGVSAPQPIRTVQPEFTEEARRAGFQGSVSIKLIVDSQGNPQDIRVMSHLGMGLEDKAVEAVRQYKFKPAMFQGHPVAVEILLDVAFRLH
jgi:TonB family protein